MKLHAWWGGPPGPRTTPRSAWSPFENSPLLRELLSMAFYRRRLPHLYQADHPVFITWRLHDSLPSHRAFPADALTSGQAFAAMDRLLDEARTGAFYLRQSAIAEMIVEAIEYNASVLGHYVVHSFVVMPNHVHLLATPAVALPKLTKSLKGITAKRANAMLGLTGKAFWQDESYDHLVRHEPEFQRIRNYIEGNPVRAGLVREASDYRWSSAGWATGGRPRSRGTAPLTNRNCEQR
jgi:putative transposase